MNNSSNLTVPNPGVPWFDEEGRPKDFAYQFFASLLNRTGGTNAPAAGGQSGLTVISQQVGANTQAVDTASAFALMALYGNVDEAKAGAAANTTTTTDLTGQLLAIMTDFDNGPGPALPQLLPLATGDLPGPVLISTVDGQCIGVPLS